MAQPPKEPIEVTTVLIIAALVAVVLVGCWVLFLNRGDPARPLIEKQIEQEKRSPEN
jgi:hypothetical protein